jgi:hypothetical protein
MPQMPQMPQRNYMTVFAEFGSCIYLVQAARLTAGLFCKLFGAKSRNCGSI